jgi:hypothetical protein
MGGGSVVEWRKVRLVVNTETSLLRYFLDEDV